MKPPPCETCKFWDEYIDASTGEEQGLGYCKADLPKMPIAIGESDTWPETLDHEGCWKHEPNPEETTTKTYADAIHDALAIVQSQGHPTELGEITERGRLLLSERLLKLLEPDKAAEGSEG